MRGNGPRGTGRDTIITRRTTVHEQSLCHSTGRTQPIRSNRRRRSLDGRSLRMFDEFLCSPDGRDDGILQEISPTIGGICCHLSTQDLANGQNSCPARPQPAKGRGVRCMYVEALSEARTKLAAIFTIRITSRRRHVAYRLPHTGHKLRIRHPTQDDSPG